MHLLSSFFLILLLTVASLGQDTNLSSKYFEITQDFEENRGQTDSTAKYILRGKEINVFVTRTGATLTVQRGKMAAALRMEVVGATGYGTVIGESPTEGRSSYFRGNDPSKWVAGAKQFEKVRVQSVRRGVDLLYYANGKHFEYDLIVKPGVNPEEIRMRLVGAKCVSLTPDGELKIETAAGDLVQHRPHLWQLSESGAEPVTGHYRIFNGDEVSVVIGRYDRKGELVIDPVLSYSTYLGGSVGDRGAAIAVDASGNAYVTGQTSSADFPTTVGAYRIAENGSSGDVFVSKLNATGTALLNSTYLGGSSADQGTGIAVDSSGNVYITGTTSSADFPVTPGAFQLTKTSTACCPSTNIFVSKLNASGTSLLYSTYLGGSGLDVASGIQVDSMGNAYIAGNTTSVDFPVTTGAYSNLFQGRQSAFVTKLNPSASEIVYSTYLGASGYNVGYTSASAIALDKADNLYVTGFTSCLDFPTTSEVYQPSTNIYISDAAFISKISGDGSTLEASTYLGPPPGSAVPSLSQTMAIALDSLGNVYVTGQTFSPSFPITNNSLEAAFTSNPPNYTISIGFVSKLNPSLTSLNYSTFLGGYPAPNQAITGTYANAIAVDSLGYIYVAGSTATYNFPLTPDAISGRKNIGNTTGFLTQLNPSSPSPLFSTILGGSGTDSANALAIDSNRGVYVTGASSSVDFPVTSGAYQTAIHSSLFYNPNAFISKLNSSAPSICSISISPSNYSAPVFGGTSSFEITAPQGCPWSVYNVSPSVTIDGPTSGTGNAIVTFSISSNASFGFSLTDLILAGPTVFTISQPAGSCSTPQILPLMASFGSTGGQSQITITWPLGCLFKTSSLAPWITIASGAQGDGIGQINFVVDRDDFAGRTANLSIAGTTFPVMQAGGGCTSSATVSSSAGAGGGTGVISLTTSSPSCVWNAYSLVSWIQLGAASGTGSASFGITLAQNPGSAARTGQILIAGQTLTVNQAAGPIGTPAAYTISTIAGTGTQGFSGDGGAAINAQINSPDGLGFDAIGNLYIADAFNYRVRKVGLDGTISTVVGNGSSSDSGNGASASAAGTNFPDGVVVGPLGDLYILEENSGPGAVRKVTGGIINAFASNVGLFSIAVDSANNVYTAGFGEVQRINPSSQVTPFAGNGVTGFSGDNGPPALASFGINILGLALDSLSNLYLSDSSNNRIRRIAGNVITTIAGTGASGFNGDGIASATTLSEPWGLAVDPLGNVIFVDSGNSRVRRFAPGGNLATIAGTGATSAQNQNDGDGGPALSAQFNSLRPLAIDPFGNIALGDTGSYLVRLLTPAYNFCTYSISAPPPTTAPVNGANESAIVSTTPGCAWNAYSSSAWITFPTPFGTDSGSVSLVVAANTFGVPRTGTVNIAGQTFPVTQQGVPSIPTAVSVSPASGLGSTQMFTAMYSDSVGAAFLNDRTMIINASLSPVAGCMVQVDPSGIYLMNDVGSAYLGPLASGSTLSNGQCTVYATGSGISNSGNNSTVTLSLSFAPGFAGVKNIYINAGDTSGNHSSWIVAGTYTVPGGTISPVAVTPSAGSGTSQTFTATFSDTAGAASLVDRTMIVNSSLSPVAGCMVQADPGGIYLMNDFGSAYLGPLASGSTLSNGQCTVYATGSSISNSGKNSTVMLSLSFSAGFAGVKNIYINAGDTAGNHSSWLAAATYAIN